MYEEFFGLRCRPFEDRAEPQFTYVWPQFEEALAAMEYQARNGAGMGLLLGEAGLGKTQLIRALLVRLHATDHAVVLTWPVGGTGDLVREACKAFGVSVSSQSAERRLARLRKHVQRIGEAGHRAILIVDQAENLSLDNLRQIAMLTDSAGGERTRLAVLLVGLPRFRGQLAAPELARLQQQLYGEQRLAPLDVEHTRSYICHRLQVAGAANPALFDEDALPLVHRAAQGVPRLINRICDEAMLAAYGAGSSRVTRELVLDSARQHAFEERTIDASRIGVATGEGKPIARRPVEVHEGLPSAATVGGGGRDEAQWSHFEPRGASPPIEGDGIGTGWDWDGGDGSTDTDASVQTEARALLDRLEAAVARADRVTIAAETSYARFAAVEKHLCALTSHAEKLIREVGTTLRTGEGSAQAIESRIHDAIETAEQRAAQLSGRLVRAGEVSTDADGRLAQLDEACTRAGDAESRLADFAEQLADKAGQLQERITLLVAGAETGEKTRAALAEAVEQATARIAEAERSADDRQHRIEKCAADASAKLEAELRKALTRSDEACTATHAATEELLAAVAKAEKVEVQCVQQVRERCRSAVDEHLAGLEERTGEIVDASQRRLEQLRRQTAEAEDTLARRANEMVEKARGELAGVQKRGQETVEALAAECRDALSAQGRSQLKEQSEAMTRLEASFRNRVDEAAATCESRVERIENVIAGLEARKKTVGEGLAEYARDIEGSAERLDGMRPAAEALTETVDQAEARIETLSGRIGELVERADQAAENTRQTMQATERHLSDAQAARGRLEAVQQQIAAGLLDVGRASQQVESIGEQARACQETAERLTREHQAAAKVADRIAAMIQDGNQVQRALRAAVAEASTRSGELGLHCGEAGKTLAELAQAQVEGQALVEKTRAASAEAERTQQAAMAANAALTETAARANDVDRSLAENVASGQRVQEGASEALSGVETASQALVSELKRAETALADLAQTHAAASAAANDLNQIIQRGRQSAEETEARLEAATHDMDAAAQRCDERTRGLDQRAGRAGTLLAELTRAMEPAEKLATRIAGLIERQERLDGEAAEASDRLAAYLAEVGPMLDGAGESFRALMSRLESVDGRLGSLAEQSKQLEQRVRDATQRPQEVIDEAKAQAAELERVCTAVRKIFAGLSRAGLEAHQQSGRLERTSGQAAQRLDELTVQTQRAAQTLQEWVDEALRAQARLERTLAECPSIHDTHPPDSIRRLAGPSGGVVQVSKRIERGLETAGVRKQPEVSGKRPEAPPASRAEAVARLLEEARQAPSPS